MFALNFQRGEFNNLFTFLQFRWICEIYFNLAIFIIPTLFITPSDCKPLIHFLNSSVWKLDKVKFIYLFEETFYRVNSYPLVLITINYSTDPQSTIFKKKVSPFSYFIHFILFKIKQMMKILLCLQFSRKMDTSSNKKTNCLLSNALNAEMLRARSNLIWLSEKHILDGWQTFIALKFN